MHTSCVLGECYVVQRALGYYVCERINPWRGYGGSGPGAAGEMGRRILHRARVLVAVLGDSEFRRALRKDVLFFIYYFYGNRVGSKSDEKN